jgi:ribosomal-protein-alanine N-acetyltransferase
MSLDSKPIGILIGHYLYQSSDLDEFEILHIAILPNFRNRGFALNLMEELEKLLNINKKSLKIFLEVSSSNKFAIKLYEKLGYKAYNERKNYYRGNSLNSFAFQDAILFAKSLDDIS